MGEEKILDIILENIKDLRSEVRENFNSIKVDMSVKFTDVEKKIAKIQEEMIKKNECNELRNNCNKPAELEVLRSEWSYKKIIAIGGIITGTLTASTAAIVSILKIFYN